MTQKNVLVIIFHALYIGAMLWCDVVQNKGRKRNASRVEGGTKRCTQSLAYRHLYLPCWTNRVRKTEPENQLGLEAQNEHLQAPFCAYWAKPTLQAVLSQGQF